MDCLLELKKIDKSFGVVHAIDNISLQVKKGELLALVGENGAGKSTLMKILTGVYRMDHGEVLIEGKSASISGTKSALGYKIGQVYQTAELVEELTVTENILLGMKDFGENGIIRWSEKFEEIQKLLDEYCLPISAKDEIKHLSIASRQFVAIAKVIAQQSNIFIFDEPTAVLSYNEVDILFSLIRRLKDNGKTIIYISHRLEEIFEISDRVAVLRDGKLVTVLENRNLKADDLIRHMLGKEITNMYPEKSEYMSGEVILELQNVSTNYIENISFTLNRGEILGIAGLVGSGRSEIVRTIFGLTKLTAGRILLNGKYVEIRSPKMALRNSIFLAPEDRRGEGLVLSESIRSNMTLSNLKKVFKKGWLMRNYEGRITAEQVELLKIKTPSVETHAGNLSGGNQQKVIIAKAVITKPEILIFDEPTQGIDVGVKSEIYRLLLKLRNEGKAIILISSELIELQSLCSRIVVMKDWKMSGEVEGESNNTENILRLMYKN